MHMVTTDEINERIASIPSMPKVITSVLEICEDPKASVADIVETIKFDEATTLKVLNLCNSSYYGLPKKVDTLQDAVVYIGLNTLVNLLLASVASDFYRNEQKNYRLGRSELWRHSVATAIGSQLIGQLVRYSKPEQLFTCGLLHDIGKVVLDDYLADNLDQIKQKIEDCGYTILQAEEELLGISHAEAGYMVGEQWNLPQSLKEVIRSHHDPLSSSGYTFECCVVHMSNSLVANLGIGVGRFGMAVGLQAGALIHCKITHQKLVNLSAELISRYQGALDLVNMAN